PEKTAGPLFDDTKESALTDFMIQWGQETSQIYESFTPSATGDMKGLVFPTDVISSLAVNDQPVAAYWSEDGVSIESGDYAIVAAFSTQTPEANASYYLFALVNEQPVVLVSQQSESQPDGLIHFQPTDKSALQTGFQQIIETGSFN